MTATSWNQTAAGLIRRGGYVPETASMEAAAELTAHDRLAAHRSFHEAWGDVVTVQQALVARGWTGAWISLDHTVAPELRPLFAGAALAQTRSGVDAPGSAPDPLIAEHRRTVAERVRVVQARLDAIDAPGDAPYRITRSVAGPSGDGDGW